MMVLEACGHSLFRWCWGVVFVLVCLVPHSYLSLHVVFFSLQSHEVWKHVQLYIIYYTSPNNSTCIKNQLMFHKSKGSIPLPRSIRCVFPSISKAMTRYNTLAGLLDLLCINFGKMWIFMVGVFPHLTSNTSLVSRLESWFQWIYQNFFLIHT